MKAEAFDAFRESGEKQIHTMAAKLVYGARWDSDSYNRLIVDEALINHFEASDSDGSQNLLNKGDSFKEKCQSVTLYRPREPVRNVLPQTATGLPHTSQNLLSTQRTPMDVVTSYERYTPEYTLHKRQYVPFMLKNIKVTPVPRDLEDTHLSECLQLTFIQDGKVSITNQG